MFGDYDMKNIVETDKKLFEFQSYFSDVITQVWPIGLPTGLIN